jgi:hypothetical protein
MARKMLRNVEIRGVQAARNGPSHSLGPGSGIIGLREVTMIKLTDEQACVLKQGYPVRVSVPELGGDVVLVLAAQRESTESVLQETLDEIREKAALSKLGRRAAASRVKYPITKVKDL